MKKPKTKAPKKRKHVYTVYVGNVGCVHRGEVRCVAAKEYKEWVVVSKTGTGRASNEPVTLFRGMDILKEHNPPGSGGDA